MARGMRARSQSPRARVQAQSPTRANHPSVVAVAESGLKTPGDLSRLRALRYDAFLIGERFMTEPDPGAALARLKQEAEAQLAEARP